MILYVISITLAVIVVILTLQYLIGRTRGSATLMGVSLKQMGISLVVAAVIGAILFLTFTGRLHWMAAVFAAALPFLRRLGGLLRYLPLAGRLAQQARSWGGPSTAGAAPDRSRVQTKYLDMSLNHGTGKMEGQITAGHFRGQTLSSLSMTQLSELRRELASLDQESVRLLETYLDRRYGDEWHEEEATPPPPSGGNSMTRKEALNVLGLQDPKPPADAIRQAHRRLIQKLHPDRGGSDYLAAKLNEAKALLLEEVT